MSLVAFLEALFDHGQTRVEPPDPRVAVPDTQEALAWLSAAEREARWALPGPPPPFAPQVALWAAEQLHRACQAAVYRMLDGEALSALLSTPCPTAEPAARAWSVDLTWQALPDLIRLTRAASPDDPLVARLLAWGAEWPLSSVGVKGVEPGSLAGIVEHPTLLRLYVDRVLAAQDWDRLADGQVRAAARIAVGGWAELAPGVAKHLVPLNLEPVSS